MGVPKKTNGDKMPTIKISGMKCGHCSASVTKTLNDLNGISGATVDLQKGEASYDENTPVTSEIIKNAIESIGFKIEE